MPTMDHDLETIRALLRARAAEVGETLLGPPSYRSRSEFRWGRKGSLSLAIAGERAGLWHDYEAGTGGDLLALVMRERRCGFRNAVAWARGFLGEPQPSRDGRKPPPPPPPPPAPDDAERAPSRTLELARRLWREAVPATGTLVEIYLAHRGLRLEPRMPLRFHPRAWRNRANGPPGPAMVALMTCLEWDEPSGVHLTYLRGDGRGKADGASPKVMLGKRGIVRLSPDEEVTLGIGLAEGIETAVAVMQRLGWRPVWAATCAGAVASFPVLPGIESLTVFADADPAGMRVAEECARRWSAAARESYVWTPAEGDWRDAACPEAA
jgi:putative DNA primase/helicase